MVVGEEGFPCPDCLGTGALPIIGQVKVQKETFRKLDLVIAEQASQRVDLTAALTAIWDKVKNL
jgi:hypothetical protein